ncbi:DUF63 family protein [Halospeciosus flavus]|uniref:DUF63 family protein n=1 Tax=Halospeciosus flavus TaxID=3032283 RepID=A0ABD5Z8M1_9EURY|nr:DUF63 family protein [Halospeciosus flavus]
MALASGYSVPALPYLAVVLLAAAGVGWALVRERPPVTARTILAWAPWMAVGSALYVNYQLGTVPRLLEPFASSPTVYLTTFALAGAVWLATMHTPAPRRVLAGVGFLAFSVPVAVALDYGTSRGTLTLLWPLGSAVVSAAVAAGVWAAFHRVRPDDAKVADGAGALVVLGHSLDAFSTAVGVGHLGFGEQTPLSRYLIEFGHAIVDLPGLGGAWLFVLVKLALAAGIVALLADYVREEPAEGYVLLGFVAAVGLGPGVHNVLLFVAATP